MKLYSTNDRSHVVDLREAVFRGLPADKGLYWPEDIPALPGEFMRNLPDYTFEEIAFKIAHSLIQDAIPIEELKAIIRRSIDFPAPVVRLNDRQYVLELFHGPSLAFKDFGARFMAQLMSYFNRGESQDLVILVATSGDTGGAVAAGFYQTPGIQVVILYPSGKVSPLQEKQLTTLGHNISALEVRGTFDDCQAMVKRAFLDQDLQKNIRLSSANSINIARLIPQSFYYFEAYKQLPVSDIPVVFSVPSGNFGNLTAGLLAAKMGLPIAHFIAATNTNDVVPEYLADGSYHSRPSVRTISNAMDVGNPSNFARMVALFDSSDNTPFLPERAWQSMKSRISGYGFKDDVTRQAIKDVYEKYRYVLDPHTAVGFLALEQYQQDFPESRGVVLSTAHPSKFIQEVSDILGEDTVTIPDRLASLKDRDKHATPMDTDFTKFKQWLLQHY